MSKLYGSAPIDEIRLAHQAADYVTALNGELPTGENLRQLTREQGIELATMIFYQSILSTNEHREFIAKVDNTEIQKKYLRGEIKLFIVPAFFYKEYPEVGGDGKHVKEVAIACGIEAEIVSIQSTGTVTENCNILKAALTHSRAKEIWLFSMSKGSAEVRMLLQDYPHDIPLERIRVWFNASGLANGCDLIDHMLSTSARRIRTRALCMATGADYRGLKQLLSNQADWHKPFVMPTTLRVVNILGVPLLSHVQRALISRYNRLKHLGPNDGMVVLHKAYLPIGPIYPLWGADHFLRDSRVIPLLYRLFGSMRNSD